MAEVHIYEHGSQRRQGNRQGNRPARHTEHLFVSISRTATWVTKEARRDEHTLMRRMALENGPGALESHISVLLSCMDVHMYVCM